MDTSSEKNPESQENILLRIPVLSSYAEGLESHVRERYLKKISVVGVDPAAIPKEQFHSECLPPIEVSDLLSYLVLETSYYTNKQFKAFKSLEAYKQVVSGFVNSVQGAEILNKIVVVAKVKHSQRMNDPLIDIWIIAESDGTILSAHCLGCKAGLAESCSHVASVLFYIEAVTRIQGKLACTVKTGHVNLTVKKFGLFINKEHEFLHATPDFLVSCDCCGTGCGEVKCPIIIKDGNFENFAQQKNSCLEKVNGHLQLRKNHSYYYQVQQQLFSVPGIKYCEFVVCAIDEKKSMNLIVLRIYPDEQHWNSVLPKLETFWRICILPEILGRWYTRRCTVPPKLPEKDGICFCRNIRHEETISCSNKNCPYKRFHPSCLSLTAMRKPKTWYCPHCSRLPQFKRRGGTRTSAQPPTASIQAAMKLDSICICKTKPSTTEKVVECHGDNCENGKFFHLSCLGLNRMPNNYQTTWKCSECNKVATVHSATTLAKYCSSSDSSSGEEESDISIIKVTHGSSDKSSPLGNLTDSHFDLILSPTGWLDCDIIHQAQVLLRGENSSIEGFQRPTLGPVRNFDVVSGEFIQISHTGHSHWVCVSSIGCELGHVNLYDSLYHDSVLTQEVEEQTNDLLGGCLVALNPMPVQQQTNGSDCGVFAIAFSTCLVFGEDPTFINFDTQSMRTHLASCLSNGKFTLFPTF